jgi:hypothetical protein
MKKIYDHDDRKYKHFIKERFKLEMYYAKDNISEANVNPLSTKLYLYDLKTYFVPRSKHSLPRF